MAMAPPPKRPSSTEALTTISNVLLAAFVICALYFGRELLVPIALAALLTFLLAPLVTRLQRWMGRVGAVLLVVTMMFLAAAGVGWVLTRQAVDLADKLPGYKENIRMKLHAIRMPEGGPFARLSSTVEELKKELPGAKEQTPPGADVRDPATITPVKVVKDGRLEFIQVFIAPIVGPLGTAALVLLLLIFMLLQREDLRNRLIRLVGQGRIRSTTVALDEAGSRVSSYLRMQLVVNATYGIAVAAGLYFIGLPNALLWGALTAVLRFIPYVGPWIGAAFPVLLSLAVSPGWATPLMTITLFIVLELISNNVMEPWLYGASTGVTPIALIVAAVVWTWLWGPVGLVLATPLTVCLVVMGRHIPRLSFLSVVLSDEDPLTPAEDCYHRLNRVGEHDEMELVEQFLKSNTKSALFDTVLIPAMVAAERDHRAGLLETDQLDFIEDGLRHILDDVELRREPFGGEPLGLRVCCVPARARRDHLAGEMVAQLLAQTGCSVSTATDKMVSGELAGWIGNHHPDAVCISVVPPSTAIHARYLCTRLRNHFPDIYLLVGLWGAALDPEATGTLREAGASEVVATMAGAVERIASRAPLPSLSEPRIPDLATGSA